MDMKEVRRMADEVCGKVERRFGVTIPANDPLRFYALVFAGYYPAFLRQNPGGRMSPEELRRELYAGREDSISLTAPEFILVALMEEFYDLLPGKKEPDSSRRWIPLLAFLAGCLLTLGVWYYAI